MSIASEIVRLQTAKEDLATAIEGKGVTVPASVTLDGYANLVDQIAQGADLQSKSVSYTPTESAQGSTITADSGYDGLSSVDVSVGAVSSTYVGSGVTRRTSSSLTAIGATVTAPAGYYESAATKSVSSGSATAPASISGTSATVSTGTNTLTLTKTVSVTPSVSAGYISSGTAGNSSVSLEASVTTQAAKTITPTTSDQTPIAAGTYCTGAIKVAKIPNQATGGAKYATTSSQTLVTAPKYITSNITLGALSQTNLTAANIKSGVNVKISNGSTNVWNITGTAAIRYSYSATVTPTSSQKKNFSCSSNAGVSTVNAFYVSFNPGFVPTTVLCVCTTQTLFRSSYDSRLGTYVLMNESGNYYACTGFTMTSSSVIVPVAPNWNTGLSFYVSAWA